VNRLIQWLDKNLGEALSPVGALIGIGLVIAGLGAGIAFSSGRAHLGIFLFAIFLAIIIVLTIAALRTDPMRGITAAERRTRWANAPRFVRMSVYVLIGGAIFDLALGATQGRLLFLAAGISSIIVARGMQIVRPPIPRPKQAPLCYEVAPEQYLATARKLILAHYVSGVLLLLSSIIGFWKHVP